MVVLTLLAWATQTLYRQWGYGAVILPQPTGEFVGASLAPTSMAPTTPAAASAATLELRDRIHIAGDVVTLRDVCRWSDHDASAVNSLADRVLLRLDNDQTNCVKKITVDQIRTALHDAGASLATIQFSGAAACAVVKGTVSEDQITRAMTADEGAGQQVAVTNGIQPVEHIAPLPSPLPGVPGRGSLDASPATQPNTAVAAPVVSEATRLPPPTPAPAVAETAAAKAPTTAPAVVEAPQIMLKTLLIDDLLQRFALKREDLQIQFEQRDGPTLALTSPRLVFQIDSGGAQQLGAVVWRVTIKNGEDQRLVTLGARAQAWEDQIVLLRSLSPGQSVHPNDVEARRELVDKLHTGKVTSTKETIGEVASRALERGDVLTTGAVIAPNLVQAGDPVTISLKIGPTSVETVARAMDGGARGATIRAKNEATGQVYQVHVTGRGVGDVIAGTPNQDFAALNSGS